MTMRLLELITDESGYLSSTRIVGIACGFTLVGMGLAQAFSPLQVEVGDRLVEALEYVAISCLLWAQVGKFAKRTPDSVTE
jgi:hypothetical protein